MKTFAIHTLGCKVNAFESEAMREQLTAAGYSEVSFQTSADVYIIHTCAVTNTAAMKSRQKIRQAVKCNAQAIICVVGCYVQTGESELNIIDGIDVLVGSSGKANLLEYIEQAAGKKPIRHVEDVRAHATFEGSFLHHFSHQSRAFLKIQDGCNQFCSYCVIPYARGMERSMSKDKVIEAAKKLVVQGHQEIVLAGIHTGRYTSDDGSNLTVLMTAILQEIPQLARLRLSSIEVSEVSEELLQLMQKDKRIARHLHIPLQSGCDVTLKDMHRTYTTKQFSDKLQQIRTYLPDIAISSDVIAGFPGENEDHMQSTLAFIASCKMSFLHVFPYSSRAHTIAAGMPLQLQETVKKARVHQLQTLSDQLRNDYMNQMMGKPAKILIEDYKNGKGYGYTSEYIRTGVPLPSHYVGSMVSVQLLTHDGHIMYGEHKRGESDEISG